LYPVDINFFLLRISFNFSLCVYLVLASFAAYGETLAVVYPEAKPPYSEIFNQIINGIKDQSKLDIELITIEGSNKTFKEKLNKLKNLRMIITLGKSALEKTKSIQTNVPIICGAIIRSTKYNNCTGVSLIINPARFVESVKHASADINTINYIYRKNNNSELLQHANRAAKANKIQLTAHQVNSSIELIKLIDNIFNNIDPTNSIVWIGRSVIRLNSELVFPMILERAWEKRIAVITDNVVLVKRGFLISLYNDYYQMGSEIALLSEDALNGKVLPETLLLSNAYKTAFNKRTASNVSVELSIDFTNKPLLIFPSE